RRSSGWRRDEEVVRMRVVIDPWDPSYGPAADADGMSESTAEVNLAVEVAPAAWAPRRPSSHSAAPEVIVFVDGVRRIDARVWIDGDDDPTGASAGPGLCGSWAAGAVRCDRQGARVAAVEVGRG